MGHDLIFYQFSRSKVERGDFRHFLGLYAPDKLPTGRRLREIMNCFVFCIEGWDSDPREIHEGGVLVAVTNDEESPPTVYPFPNSELWHYAGFKVTQYWAKAAGTIRDDMHVAVNGRYTYWLSARPIPGGVAFENFELRQRFYDGQQSTFGITRRTPQELGLRK